ncbi:hypothetical protein [Fodinicola feengrottensis]|uniref:hypothetical protein n=1 Tax=Fodinicola feengrottensis TaxID=435914 RepID=UPI0013D45D8A|nr:hypothetical protein [Fodinicola feengrottensis]
MPDRRVHRHQKFRPDEAEYAAAMQELRDRDRLMNDFLRASLRWVADDPEAALAALAPLWPTPRPRGRRPMSATDEPPPR